MSIKEVVVYCPVDEIVRLPVGNDDSRGRVAEIPFRSRKFQLILEKQKFFFKSFVIFKSVLIQVGFNSSTVQQFNSSTA